MLTDPRKDPRLAEIRAAQKKFAPAIAAWAAAARLGREDVADEVAEAVLRGEDPRVAVPARLSIRRLARFESGKRVSCWVSLDAAAAAISTTRDDGDEFDIVDESTLEVRDEIENDLPRARALRARRALEAADLDAAVVDEIASRHRVGRRRGQKIVKAQIERYARGGDLFSAPEGDAP